MDRKTIFVSIGLTLAFAVSGIAQSVEVDRVWYQPPANSSARSNWLPRQLEYAAGTIVKFDRESLEIDPVGESQSTTIPSERIIWIEPKYSTDYGSEGMQEFEDRRFPEAVSKLFAAIGARPDVWEQQWLTAHLALAAYKVEKYTSTLNIIETWMQVSHQLHCWACCRFNGRPSRFRPARSRRLDKNWTLRKMSNDWLRQVGCWEARKTSREPNKRLKNYRTTGVNAKSAN